MLDGESILITGGTGFFGRAFVKHLLETTNVQRIVVYSRSEHAQADMASETKAFGHRLRFFIGDVRDSARLHRALHGVTHVVHAAALKRIEVGYYNPDEMVKTNVVGTMNVIEAALANNVKQVVGLSSDKAWQPISAYGHTKALAETLLLNANGMVHRERDTVFTVVRYGNVSGSTGSVIPRWRKMKAAGMTSVPVSDPDCTRFWMSINNACLLVMSAIESPVRDVLIPKLPAYRLGDLAAALNLKMDVFGLPEWEKKHEGMGPGNTSDVARRMSVEELREHLANV